MLALVLPTESLGSLSVTAGILNLLHVEMRELKKIKSPLTGYGSTPVLHLTTECSLYVLELLAAKEQLNTCTCVLSVFLFGPLCPLFYAHDSLLITADDSGLQSLSVCLSVCLSVHLKTESLPVYSLLGLGPCLIIAVNNFK